MQDWENSAGTDPGHRSPFKEASRWDRQGSHAQNRPAADTGPVIPFTGKWEAWISGEESGTFAVQINNLYYFLSFICKPSIQFSRSQHHRRIHHKVTNTRNDPWAHSQEHSQACPRPKIKQQQQQKKKNERFFPSAHFESQKSQIIKTNTNKQTNKNRT